MANDPEVIFKTDYGNFYIRLYSDMPVTTGNFLNLVVADHYNGSTFFSRLVTGFVLQGGSFYINSSDQIAQYTGLTPIQNEYMASHPNAVGTISMARTSDLNSATDAFFINIDDNSVDLVDYAAFGEIIQGMSTFDTLADLPNYDFYYSLGSNFRNLPLKAGVDPNEAGIDDLIYFEITVAAEAGNDTAQVDAGDNVAINVLANDTDMDDPTLSIAKVNGAAFAVDTPVALESGAQVTISSTGTATYDTLGAFRSLSSVDGASNSFTTDSFTYTLTDGSLAGGTATVTVTVVGTYDEDDIGYGTDGSDQLFGHDLKDIISAGAGDDFIDGGVGADWLYGGLGNDTYLVDNIGDILFEGTDEGHDSVISTSSFYLYANVEDLTLAEGAGDIFGVGNDLDNVLIGNEGQNLLIGWNGNDTIMGGDARDALFGVDGDDQLFGDAGVDYIVAGAGNDTVDGGADADEIYGQEGDDILIGGSSFDTDIIVGGEGNDTIYGNSGLGDYDFLYGNEGDDTFFVDTPADLVFEQPDEGHDTVVASISGAGFYLYDNIEDLILVGDTPFGVGNALDNSLIGSDASNWLLGGAGNDTLNGMGGNDVLFGESGADTFVFQPGTGGDVVGDFTPGEDQIDLTAYGFTWAQVQAGMSDGDGAMAINLTNGDFVVLNGVLSADLGQSDFILV